MKPIFILIRGNSGSGKTVLANKLQQYWGYENCLLLHQDVIRRNILHTNDHFESPAISLIEHLVNWGIYHYKVIILEGILRKDIYGEMLENLVDNCGNHVFVYYLDVPFRLTVEHNQNKELPFSISDLKKWWRVNDYLSRNDYCLKSGDTNSFYTKIITDINNPN